MLVVRTGAEDIDVTNLVNGEKVFPRLPGTVKAPVLPKPILENSLPRFSGRLADRFPNS